jgi:hypothetical protein
MPITGDTISYLDVETFSTTNVGPPTTSTYGTKTFSSGYVVGQRVRDKWGACWICTVAGTPGTWRYAGGGCYYSRMHITSSSIAIGSGLDGVTILFDTKDDDPVGMATTGSSAKFTVPSLGSVIWLVSFNLGLASWSSSAGEMFANVLNGATTIAHGVGRRMEPAGAHSPHIAGAVPVKATASAALTVQLYQASGASQNLSVTDTWATVALLDGL